MLVTNKIRSKNFIKKNNNNIITEIMIKYILLSYLKGLNNIKTNSEDQNEDEEEDENQDPDINFLSSIINFEINNNSILIKMKYYVLNSNDLYNNYKENIDKLEYFINKSNITYSKISQNKKNFKNKLINEKNNNNIELTRIDIKNFLNYNEKVLIHIIFNNKKISNLVELLQEYSPEKDIKINIIRIYKPYLDANIISKWVLIQLRYIKIQILIKKMIKGMKLTNIEKWSRLNKTSYFKTATTFVGFSIVLKGRSLLEKSKPRKTVIEFKTGSLKFSPRIIKNYGSEQNVNDLGSLTVSITLSSIKF